MATLAINGRIKADVRKVEAMLRAFDRGAEKVITRALNKTIKPVESVAVKTLAKDIGIKQKDVRKAVLIIRATYARQRAEVAVIGKRIPLYALGGRQTRQGVTYKAKGGGRKAIRSAFVATMRSGDVGVFKRLGKTRFPIRELYGPSIPHVMLQSHVQRAMDDEADNRWAKNLDHELKYFLSQNA